MNLSLPDFLKRNKAADDQPAAKPMPQLTGDAKPASIGKVRIQLLVTAVLLLGLLAAFVFQLMSGYILRAMEQESDVASKQVAMRVESMVDHYSKVTALLAKDPDIAYLLMVGNESALRCPGRVTALRVSRCHQCAAAGAGYYRRRHERLAAIESCRAGADACRRVR